MIDVNIVYRNTEPSDGYALRRGNVRVLWTRRPAKECALHAYLGSYSYVPGTGVPQVLLQAEPVTVHPREYTVEVLRYFDRILTLIKSLEGITPRFYRWLHPHYEQGPQPEQLAIPTLERSRALYPLDGRKNAVIMILGNKSSKIRGELYSLRREMARWFYEHSKLPFDVFGTPPFTDLPNYRGGVAHSAKLSVLAQYRFNVCFENSYDPFWTAGYMTERLLQSIEARTVPIYYGCSTIEEYVPKGCFIDYRDFDGFEDLNTYLESMPEDEYQRYIERMDAWFAEADLSQYSYFRVYDRLAEFAAEWESEDLDAHFAGETTWTPIEFPAEKRSSRIDDTMEGRGVLYWSWTFLENGTLEEVEAGLDRLRTEGDAALRPPVDVRKMGPVKPRKSSLEIRHVLYVGRMLPDPPFGGEGEYGMRNFFSTWKQYPDVQVSYFDFVAGTCTQGVDGMSQYLIETVRKLRPDLLFYLPLNRSFDMTYDALRDITEHTDTRTIAWITQDAGLFETYTRFVAPCVDYVVTTSEREYRAFKRLGFGESVIRSRWAFDPLMYRPVPVERKERVVLVGRHSEKRALVAQILRVKGVPLEVHGYGWPDAEPLPHEAFIASFRESAICLNIDGRRRVFEATGARGFLLTTPVEGLEESFLTDRIAGRRRPEIVVAHDTEELVDKIRFYLRNEALAQGIARRGQVRALREHTWFHRYQEIFQKIGWKLPPLPDGMFLSR